MSSSNLGGFVFPDDLPDVTFADADPAKIIARLTADYEKEADTTLYPADPVRLDLSTTAYEFSVAYAALDFTGKQNLLAKATGGFLDHIGAFHEVPRLAAKSATVKTQRIYAEPGLSFPVSIPATLRVSPDNTLFYKVQNAATIPAATTPDEEPYVDVVAECLTPGVAGNGFLPGQIATLVDTIPYAARTENLTTSANGAEEEEDDRYRLRIYIAPEGFSTAGPEGAYKYFALSAHQNIADVAVTSPAPCYISIYVLMQNGESPDQTILDLVAESVNPRDIRPMGDRVTISARAEVPFIIEGAFYLDEADKTREAAIRAAVRQAGTEYAVWQKTVFSRDIEPNELITRVRAAGAKHLALATPEFTAVPEGAVGIALSIALTFGGYAVPEEETPGEGGENG